jgi:mono/diheme cytochrome c family protein
MIGAMRGQRHRVGRVGVMALVTAASGSLCAQGAPVPASGDTASPLPYSTSVVARGGARFASECARCHGAEGRGDGPDAASLAKPPANLAEHALHHPPGQLFAWIAHGVRGSPMPAFAPRLSDAEIWELVQFVVACASAEAATPIGARVATARVRAPDFAYELAGAGQQTLMQRGAPTLIVLYSLPQSSQRLAALAQAHELVHANVAVVAIPLSPEDAADNPLGARTGADVASVYATFARMRARAPTAHAELLVDANGYLRARWLGVPASGANQTDAIAAAARQLARRPAAPAAPTHRHAG